MHQKGLILPNYPSTSSGRTVFHTYVRGELRFNRESRRSRTCRTMSRKMTFGARLVEGDEAAGSTGAGIRSISRGRPVEGGPALTWSPEAPPAACQGATLSFRTRLWSGLAGGKFENLRPAVGSTPQAWNCICTRFPSRNPIRPFQAHWGRT